MTAPLVIFLDPGHGGRTSYGAMWPPFAAGKGLAGEALESAMAAHAAKAFAVEKDINLALADEAKRVIESVEWPVAVALTRDANQALSLDARAEIAAKHSADLVIALHCDTSKDPDVAGLWTYVRANDSTALFVAREIMAATPRPLRRGTTEPKVARPKPDWTANAHAVMVRHTAPTVLIECGFLSNDGDRALLTGVAGRALVVSTILAGVAGWVQRKSASNIV